MKLWYGIYLISLIYSTTAEANGTISIYIAGAEEISGVKAIIRNGSAFISIDDVSERLGIVTKKIGDGMIGICRDDLCILAQLDNEDDVIRDPERLMINARLIAQALDSGVEWLISGKALRFIPLDQVVLDTVVRVGDVVPDFVLPSITDGKMLSFSSFRGKRVLLFLWGSW